MRCFLLIFVILYPYQALTWANEIQPCSVIEFDDYPEVAAKQTLNLDVGPPRKVRLIYFHYRDRPVRSHVIIGMRETILTAQSRFGQHMQARRLGYKTFDIELTNQNVPRVYIVKSQELSYHYSTH